jgi:hypothetical protein
MYFSGSGLGSGRIRTILHFVYQFQANENQYCGSMAFFVTDLDPRICVYNRMNPDLAQDPAIFVIDIRDANKKLFFFLSFPANYRTNLRYIHIIFQR